MARKSHLDLMSKEDLLVEVDTTAGYVYKGCDVVTSQFNPQVFHFWYKGNLVSIPYVNISKITHYQSEENNVVT